MQPCRPPKYEGLIQPISILFNEFEWKKEAKDVDEIFCSLQSNPPDHHGGQMMMMMMMMTMGSRR